METRSLYFELDQNAASKGEDKGLDSWFMMSSPWPTVALTGAYLFFVVVAGPKLMKVKAPLSLKSQLQLYNVAQVFFSSWVVYKVLTETYGVFISASCTPSLLSDRTSYEIDSVAWYYLMSKYVEFLDTIFFILRGKWNQVTFLHVYHHSNMALVTWFYVKYFNSMQILIIALTNSFVHAAMYSYYFLATFGPSVSRFLWWKRYITKLQIVQFLIIISFMSYLSIVGCNTSAGVIPITIINTSSFLLLFLLFYSKTYKSKKKVQ